MPDLIVLDAYRYVLTEPLLRMYRARVIGLDARLFGARVAEDLDLPVVVIAEERDREARDRVLSEIGRNVADAQAALGRAIVRVG